VVIPFNAKESAFLISFSVNLALDALSLYISSFSSDMESAEYIRTARSPFESSWETREPISRNALLGSLEKFNTSE